MIGLLDNTQGTPKPERRFEADTLVPLAFKPGGLLQEVLGLEHRPQQETMARAVSKCIEDNDGLLFEAGTGVGKSLAYLIPGILHACEQERQLIVSTHTIALQEQLDQKDLPICRKLFAQSPAFCHCADFKSAVLVGKGNYLCTTRLKAALAAKKDLLGNAEVDELQRIEAWAAGTRTGLRHELKPPPLPEVWEHVNADSSACSRKRCDDHCFYQQARNRIREARVIIVNHSLLCALINAGGARAHGGSKGVLFPDDMLVLDEAHTVPDVATEHFGLRISSYGLERQLKHLFNTRNGKGLLCRHGTKIDQELVIECLDASMLFFHSIQDSLLGRHATARLVNSNPVEGILEAPLQALAKSLDAIATRLQEGKDYDEISDQRARIEATRAGIGRWLKAADEEQVFWAERSGLRGQIVSLRSAPIDVAPELRKALFSKGVPVICTSATLALAGKIDRFQLRIGGESCRTGIEKSPFDFESNMRCYVAADIPMPANGPTRPELTQQADWIRYCVLKLTGGSLVLFTNYGDMRAVAELVRQDFVKAGRPFLMQGDGTSRTELANLMRNKGNAILFGTDSFWTGIDVPGTALEQVIITRLPFESPAHPIQQARAEHVRARGGMPFLELNLPDALMKFRQGVGRLIRSAKDRGIITILDTRILHKTYGGQFVASLPKPTLDRLTTETRTLRFRPLSAL